MSIPRGLYHPPSTEKGGPERPVDDDGETRAARGAVSGRVAGERIRLQRAVATPRRARQIVHLESASRHASRRNVRRAREEEAAPASRQTSVCERRRAQPRPWLPVFLARRREDVEHDAAHAERAAAVRHVRRRLPEVAGLYVMLDAVLDANPSRHTPHCSLGCACTGETAPGSSVTTESIACTPGNTRALTPGASCRSMPPVFRLWKHETSVMSSLLSRARRFALPRAIRAITLCPAVPPLVTRVADFEESRPCRLPPSMPPTSRSSTSRASAPAWAPSASASVPSSRRWATA